MPRIKWYDEEHDQLPESMFNALIDPPTHIMKVWDYHINGYFYCKVRSGVYKWEDYKYVIDVDNGNTKFSVWYNSSKKRWELFDGDTCDTPLRKMKVNLGSKQGWPKINRIKLGKHMTLDI